MTHRLDATLTRLDAAHTLTRKRYRTAMVIQATVITIGLACLALSLKQAEEHYRQMAKANQEQVAWTK